MRQDAHPARVKIAQSFFDASQTLEAGDQGADRYMGNTIVTNYVHAGIAASDAICCNELGEHAQGDDHSQATVLLRQGGCAMGASYLGDLQRSWV